MGIPSEDDIMELGAALFIGAHGAKFEDLKKRVAQQIVDSLKYSRSDRKKEHIIKTVDARRDKKNIILDMTFEDGTELKEIKLPFGSR